MKRKILYIAALLFTFGACKEEVTEEIVEFLEPKPVAAFSYSIPSASDPFTILFTNESKDFKVSRWSFADDSTSSEVSPTHTFLKTGNYNVKLLVQNGENFWAQRETIIKISSNNLMEIKTSLNPDGTLKIFYDSPLDIEKTEWLDGITSSSPVFSTDPVVDLNIVSGSFRNVRLRVTTPKGSVAESQVLLTDLGIVKDLTNFNNNFTSSHENPSGKDSNEGTSKLIDNNLRSKFFVNGSMPNLWFRFEFFEPQVINGYTLTAGNDAPERDPRDWKIQGSQDGSENSWVDLHTVVDAPRIPGDRGQGRASVTYKFNNSTAYQFYRMRITANHNMGGFQLAEIRLLQLPQ